MNLKSRKAWLPGILTVIVGGIISIYAQEIKNYLSTLSQFQPSIKLQLSLLIGLVTAYVALFAIRLSYDISRLYRAIKRAKRRPKLKKVITHKYKGLLWIVNIYNNNTYIFENTPCCPRCINATKLSEREKTDGFWSKGEYKTYCYFPGLYCPKEKCTFFFRYEPRNVRKSLVSDAKKDFQSEMLIPSH